MVSTRPEVTLRRKSHVRALGLLSFVLAGLLLLPSTFSSSFVAPGGSSADTPAIRQGLQAQAEASPGLSRRTAAQGAVMLALLQPAEAWAKRGGDMATKAAMPADVNTEGNMDEVWEPVDIGESTLVDPKDPKYDRLRILAREAEKQQEKNEEYDSLSKQDKLEKMCALTGRFCSSVDTDRSGEKGLKKE
eukprot:TRINITY_DN60683_c0_g1_i1.p1 TRINITY_DN60683_c0_g1~~TRINITY_DN60683_c0_g1_i1.p1  ORF type:complete len:206 (+),score=48.91 TRINITY_DN60683_c0_g1_i1:51-620(+)